ncbi:uncharacterized protein LOC132727618 [Ruditapes philippinarum]|uniref:uncharacterized protein LOC132727618 n=1 Tax=Ruditapes philippinarum TaxID=129788 RepID=UPI00295A6BC2|nr:uncharacterized protein LOC132727618 [Ruditapes philippinarum]
MDQAFAFYILCSSIIQKIGGKTYQRSNNTDCPDFEIYVHTGFTANCVKCAPDSSSTSYEFCLQQCLDVLSCRATSFDATNSKCEYFTNPCSINDHGTDLVADSGKTLIERLCFDEQPACIRQHTQSCVNCKAGILCQTHFNQIAQKKPLSINTAVVGVNSNIEQIWYTSSGSKYMYIQCPYVSQAIGDTVYRASCTQDCPKFEILTLPGHRGICSPLSALFGIVTSEFCLSKCLDMATCRGVTFDKNIKRYLIE